jgi:hypothetical protein
MATAYHLYIGVSEEKGIAWDPVESIPELAEAYVQGCDALVKEHGATADDEAIWFVLASDDGGDERDLTDVERSALYAQLEQKFPDVKVTPRSPGKPLF